MTDNTEVDKVLNGIAATLSERVDAIASSPWQFILDENPSRLKAARLLSAAALLRHSLYSLEKARDTFRQADSELADEIDALAGMMKEHLGRYHEERQFRKWIEDIKNS